MPKLFVDLRGLCLICLFFIAGAAFAVDPEPVSSPVWPFPWAKDCPTDWEALQGHYMAMPEAAAGAPVDLQIAVTEQSDGKHVVVTQVSPSGQILATRSVPESENPEQIRLSIGHGPNAEEPTSALLQMHYGSETRDCNRAQLVLTLDFADRPAHPEEQYRMQRLDDRR